jgi:hypothetical protein
MPVVLLSDLDLRTTGSLVNALQGQGGVAVPEVGMGATLLMYSDRAAYTVVAVKANKAGKVVEATLQEDEATRTDGNGMSDCQSYSFSRNSKGRLMTIRQTRDGKWREAYTDYDGKVRCTKTSSIVRLGMRDGHYDYTR